MIPSFDRAEPIQRVASGDSSWKLHRDISLEDESPWLITMCDLMSLLLIFVLVWTSVELAAKSKEAGIDPSPAVLPARFLEHLQSVVLEAAPRQQRDGSVVIVLQEQLNFASGKARLSPRGMTTLERIAPTLRGEAARYSIDILGHTDDAPVVSGTWDSNIELSLARAEAVWEALIALGIAPARLRIQGLGPLYPATSNQDPENRALNRRVELVLRPS